MRDLIPYIFWPWFGISCAVLLRRRVSSGGWRSMAEQDSPAAIEFPPPPPNSLPDPSVAADDCSDAADPGDASDPVASARTLDDATTAAFAPTPVAVMTPVDTDRPRARSLAEAVEGIAMPCDLAPLMGSGPSNPREVAFFTDGHAPASVGSALADEFERLGYEITPLDDRSIQATRGPDAIEARLISVELTSEEVMRELHPSAPEGALVVEMKLT